MSVQFNPAYFNNIPEVKKTFDNNRTDIILDGLADLNATGDSWYGKDKEAYRQALLERATQNDGVVSPREEELINKAVDGKITNEERAELINLLPAMSPKRFESMSNFSKKSDADLLDEVKDIKTEDTNHDGHFDQVNDSMDSDDFRSLEELKRRASQDGKMSPELNALFSKMFDQGKTLTPQEYSRFKELLKKEDNIGA
jgi:hypothetical protein